MLATSLVEKPLLKINNNNNVTSTEMGAFIQESPQQQSAQLPPQKVPAPRLVMQHIHPQQVGEHHQVIGDQSEKHTSSSVAVVAPQIEQQSPWTLLDPNQIVHFSDGSHQQMLSCPGQPDQYIITTAAARDNFNHHHYHPAPQHHAATTAATCQLCIAASGYQQLYPIVAASAPAIKSDFNSIVHQRAETGSLSYDNPNEQRRQKRRRRRGSADGTGSKGNNYKGFNKSQHNEIERTRRLRIKNCCDTLRGLVPGLGDKVDKANVLEYTVRFVKHIISSKEFKAKLNDNSWMIE